MPILPPITDPKDPTETVLQFARVIANDATISLAGNLLSDSQPYVPTLLQLAWRKLQDRLGNNAIEDFPSETILLGVTAMPAGPVSDPGTQVYVGFDGYYDGFAVNPAPTLPLDLETPLKLWERASGINAQFIEMNQINTGLPSRSKSTMLREWEYRQQKIFMVGATQDNEIRLRYRKRYDDPEIDGVIPIIDCAVALAYNVVDIFALSRGSTVSAQFTMEREEATKQLVNRSTRKKQRSNFRRQPYSRRGSRLNW